MRAKQCLVNRPIDVPGFPFGSCIKTIPMKMSSAHKLLFMQIKSSQVLQISALKYKNRNIGKGKIMSVVGSFAEFGTPK